MDPPIFSAVTTLMQQILFSTNTRIK